MSSEPRDNSVCVPKSWPFEEAARIVSHIEKRGKDKQTPALLETGYGPSGLPHIGTFGEVARTSWVRQAYMDITGMPARILAFSDDMDGLRKVPDNVPNKEMLKQHLGMPLSRIPDPFGTHESFGAHNNARLCAFLDGFGFDYEFASSTEYYASGRFDAALRRVLEVHEEIIAVVAPTLGPDRRATYSPVLPIHPKTGAVMQVRIEKVDPDAATVVWRDEDGVAYETPVTGGHAKLQWKADWAMRWYALDVDYEMSGKDLIDSVRLSGKICRILGKEPPAGLTYELFLDEHGQKISKSKGNGLSVEEWLQYAPAESLAQYMFNAPQRAKRLFFDVIPRAADEYFANVDKYLTEGEAAARKANPAWFIKAGHVTPADGSEVSFSMLLNLAGAANAENPDILWGFLKRYDPDLAAEKQPMLTRMVDHAIAYYQSFVKPNKDYRSPTQHERAALSALAEGLKNLEGKGADGAQLQNLVFEVGKNHGFEPLRSWFGCLYEVLLGQKDGPRFGMFMALYGIKESVRLIEVALER